MSSDCECGSSVYGLRLDLGAMSHSGGKWMGIHLKTRLVLASFLKIPYDPRILGKKKLSTKLAYNKVCLGIDYLIGIEIFLLKIL